MGVYDTFEDAQLKIGACEGHTYHVGDQVMGVDDGVYVSYEGVVVIRDGKFIAFYKKFHDKWGAEMDPSVIVGDRNDVNEAVVKAQAAADAGSSTDPLLAAVGSCIEIARQRSDPGSGYGPAMRWICDILSEAKEKYLKSKG